MAGPRTPTGSLRRRASWSLVDQGLSSGSNFLLLFVVIWSSSTREVGAFSLAYTSFFFALAAIRGFALEPLTVRHASATVEHWRQATSCAVGTALAIATALAAATLVGAWAGGGVIGAVFAATAIMLPGLVVQDAWRQAFFAARRPGAACLNDLALLVVQVVGYVLLAQFSSVTMVSLILVWGAAASLAALLGAAQARVVPRPWRTREWHRENRDLGPAFAADHLASRGAEQLAMFAVGAVAGLGALGAVATARALFAPMTTVQSGLNAVAMPETARLHLAGRIQALRRFSLLYGGSMGLLMVLTGAALYLLPREVTVSLLQDNGDAARSVLVPMTVFSVLNAFALGLWTGLRGMQLAAPTFWARAGAGVVTLAAASLGAAYAGANGAVWGMALGAGTLGLAMVALLFRPPPAVREPATGDARQPTEAPELLTQPQPVRR